MTLQELVQCQQQAELLYDATQIKQALKKQAEQITLKLQALCQDHDEPALVLAVMNGGLIYAGQVLPELGVPVQVDYIHATRYRNSTQGYELEWKVYPQHSLENRVVLILDDIFDEGHTLDEIIKYCRQQKAAEVLSAVLVTKDHDRRAEGLSVNFSALNVPDRYVFGYGMDYKGHLRNLNGIHAL